MNTYYTNKVVYCQRVDNTYLVNGCCFFAEYKVTEQEESVSLMGSGFAKLDGTNYGMWSMQMTDILQRERV